MALPTNLAAKIKTIPMDPTAMATEPDLAYLLSFAQHPIAHDSIYTSPRESSVSHLENYAFADFEEETFEQLQEETCRNYQARSRQLVRGIRCGFKEFYGRVSANLHTSALNFMARERNQAERKFTLVKDEEEVRIEALKGNNPQRWPDSIREFIKELNGLPWYAFLNDSELFLNDFVEGAKNAMVTLCKRAKAGDEAFKDTLLLQIQAFLGVILRTNNQSYILQQLRFLTDLHKHLQLTADFQSSICGHIYKIFNTFFASIPQEPASKYHYPQSLWNRESFLIMKKKHFQKYAGLAYYSIATDGKFLYFYISAINGGMFKVGTGNEDTKAGKVYLERQIHFPIGTKVDEVNWVYAQGKLYLKTSSKDPWLLEVYSPDTLRKEGNVQLFCPSLFGLQSLINLNKNTPILTDGASIFYLGSRIKIQKCEPSEKLQEKSKPQQKSPEKEKQTQQKKNDKKKKKTKKNQTNPPTEQQKNQNYQKVLEIVLYQFPLDGNPNRTYQDIDQKYIDQLYDSFSGYFTRQQCKRAFVLNDYDLAQTCQWLFNEGQKEKEKNIKILEHKDYVILLEAEITSNFQQKNIKGHSQITTKEGSTLHINNLFESIWTMDNEHITCYSENGVKIFSRNKADFKVNQDTKLGTTLLKTLQSKFPKNPEYSIIYDPYNSIFYTFAWPQDGHYFPTVILASNDKKQVIRLQEQRKFNAKVKNISKLTDLSKFALHHMNLLDKSCIKNRYRFNDWLWFYGQRINEIATQMNQADSDKKRLTNRRTKLMGKLNKINQIQRRFEKDKATLAKNGKITREIIKIYPFDSEGDAKNYKLIVQAFKGLTDYPEEVYLYVLCLENWLANAPSSANVEVKAVLLQIGESLLRLKSASDGKNRSYINRLIQQQFYLFYPTLERQVRFIVSLSDEELQEFIRSQTAADRKEKESIIYQLTKKQHIVQKYQTGKADFAQIFKAKSTIVVGQAEEVELIGNLLLGQILKVEKEKLVFRSKYEEPLRRQLLDYLQQRALSSPTGNKFIQYLFLSSFKLLNSNSKDLHAFLKHQQDLFTEVFRLYEKVLAKSKPDQLFYVLPTFLMVVQLYHGSLTPLAPSQDIISSLLKSIQSIQKPQFNQVLSFIQQSEFEGVSPTSEKVYETSHPLQRGKNYNFPPRNFPHASLVLLDLDKRCQSDPNNDTLNIQILHEDCVVGNNIQVNDGVFSSYLRLSGTVDTKKPYLIFGNALNVDFNSSGQVKDTQSLVRYGFKFGLRPIFTGKARFAPNKRDKVEKVFGNIGNFEVYFNTLKFTVVAVSNTIQNYLHLQNQQADPKIGELLKNKIFKEGFEQNSYKFETKGITPYEIVNKFMKQTQLSSHDQFILQKNHEKLWNVEEKQALPANKQKQPLWNFQGIPSYIKGYLQQIQQFKGDFIDVFTEARQLAKEKGSYAHMMRRKTFEDKHKQFWLQGESILFLTILKHSGLLHLNLKFSIQYIKENLKAFEDARDGIYYSLISRIQNVNEWRDLLETYIGRDAVEEEEKKEEPEEKKPANINISLKRKGKTVKSMKLGQEKPAPKKQKVQEKPVQKGMNKVEFEKVTRQRLSNNQALVKGICNIRKIRYDETNPYENVSRIIEEVIKQSQRPLESPESVYTEPIEHLIRCCLFLLKFRSPSTKQSLQSNEQIVPVSIGRSLSSDNRNVDTNKLNIFREWLQNWKKWKGFKREGRIQLKFPVQEIVKYINAWIDLGSIEAAIRTRYYQCTNRTLFYSGNNQLIKAFANSPLVRYTLGTQTLNLHQNYLASLSSISQSKLKELQQVYTLFRSHLKTVESTLMEKLPVKLSQLEALLKDKSVDFLQRAKPLLHTLFLLESQNPDISLELALYFIPFRHLSGQNQDITYLASSLVQRALIGQHANATLINLLEKEVGRTSVNFKRWKDLFFVERALFLLKKLQSNCRKKVAVQEKMRLAELLFFILYHIEVPILAKVALKILRRFKISLKEGMRTPLDYEYTLCTITEKQKLTIKETFKLSPSLCRNNVELLCAKIHNIFEESHQNQLQAKFQGPLSLQRERSEEEERYNIIINLHQEEDLYWLVKVLFYVDELEVKAGEKNIPQYKDYAEYLAQKGKKREDNKRDQQQQQANQAEKEKPKDPERRERIFTNLPKISNVDPDLEEQLPLGWFYNYCNIFADPLERQQSPPNPKAKGNTNANQNAPKGRPAKNNNNNNNNAKKQWAMPIFGRWIKKYEQLNSKPIQQPKEGDADDAKQQFIRAKNFQSRIRSYLREINILMDSFTRNGYSIFKEDVPRTRMNQLCQLLTVGSSNRLKDIPLDLKNGQIKGRLMVNDFQPNFTSRVKITLIKTRHYPYFQQLIAYQGLLSSRNDPATASLLARRELSLPDSRAFMPYEEFPALDEPAEEDPVQFGKQWVESGISRMRKKTQRVFLNDYPGCTFFLAQGGIESGVRDNILVPANDAALTLQTTAFEKILTLPRNQVEKEYEETDFPEELIEKIQRILQRGSIAVTSKSDVREFLLLTFYLKKLNHCDLQFVSKAASQKFTQKLLKFTAGLNSFKELRQYEQDVQKLILKLIDNEHEKLHLFGNYLSDEDFHPDVEEYLVPMKLQKLNSSNDVKQEGADTHSCIKSKYLLKSQAPQIEQNKLLKYWEKNILPKIYEFVKTTLKQIEIDDFWEQMRRPLRVGDHTDAKRVAYIICDNKLPAGAVIPDSNHNWNSLELQQIFVGENVLVKLPKRGEFGTPLLGWGGQEQRLARIVFIDLKSSTVLVRYRVEELSIFSYTWVPVNALMAVEKEVMHISTRSIYEELEKKLEGMVYIHAKQCLTKLAPTVSAQDSLRLLRQTILDLFIDNPISGVFDYPRPAWPMRGVFERMVQEGDLALVQLLEKQFTTVRGLDINLNSEKMTSLNRFDDAKALIVSFKKQARLSQCSGIRFFSDKYGYNEVAHVYTAKSERTDIQPLQFNDPNIHCAFYTNKECLPIIEQNNYKLYPVEATVFAVDDMWTIGCYVGELLCEIAVQKQTPALLNVLQRVNRLFVKWILKKSVSVLCAYLARLIAKVSMTINFLCERNAIEPTLQRFGVAPEQLKELLKWVNYLTDEQSKAKVTLYSALLQNLSEMTASIIYRLPPAVATPPEHVKASIQLMRILKEIAQFTRTKKLSGLIANPPAPSYQWERILQVSNIPNYFDRDTIRRKMREIIQHNKGKILCPTFDIHLTGGNCFLLVDGWDINELVQEQVIEKIEQEQEEKQEEEEMGMMTWICAACTFQNPAAFNLCEICQSAAPVAAKQEEVYDVVVATDLKAAERKLKQREAKRFEEVKVQILKFFEDQYKTVCELIEKRNKEIEQGNKAKEAARKNKKGEVVRDEPLQIPKKPQVKLQTGSTVFQNPAIEQFLEGRYKALPADLRKQVQNEQTYIAKFKKFLSLGYDLWGDNIANESATLIPFSLLYQLMDYIQSQICKGSSSVLSYSEESIRILSQVPLLDVKGNEEPINYVSESDMGVRVKYKQLGGLKSYNIRYSWKFVKELNLAASKCLQFINMDLKLDKERADSTPAYNDCLGYIIKYFRTLVMGVIKLELFQKIMQKTSVARQNDQVPRVELERLKAREIRTKEGLVTAKQKEDHLFTKAHSQFLKIATAFLRPFKPKGADPYLSFTVTFKGENVMGEAGPYRQFFTDIARELAPTYNLGLFIPSPNNRHQSGEHKSRWVINPRANSTYHFSLFEYIGVLMGCCFRTGGHLALDLPTMFWKSITRQQITDADLDEVDSQLVSLLKMLRDCPSEQLLSQATDATNGEPLTWTYRSCDDELHELRPNGRNQHVEFAELGTYIEALRNKKINESRLMVKRIVQGLSQLVPMPYLHCLTGEELKLTICGRPRVDVDLLKKHTKYSGGLNEQSRRIKYFWQTIRELPEVDRLKIIRFCWGQQRLPINSEQYERNNIRFMIKPMLANQQNQDQALPKADTCFFNIQLPDYSTKAIMKEKILLAVNLDNVSINADENMMNSEDNPLMNEIDSYEQEEDYEED